MVLLVAGNIVLGITVAQKNNEIKNMNRETEMTVDKFIEEMQKHIELNKVVSFSDSNALLAQTMPIGMIDEDFVNIYGNEMVNGIAFIFSDRLYQVYKSDNQQFLEACGTGIITLMLEPSVLQFKTLKNGNFVLLTYSSEGIETTIKNAFMTVIT